MRVAPRIRERASLGALLAALSCSAPALPRESEPQTARVEDPIFEQVPSGWVEGELRLPPSWEGWTAMFREPASAWGTPRPWRGGTVIPWIASLPAGTHELRVELLPRRGIPAYVTTIDVPVHGSGERCIVDLPPRATLTVRLPGHAGPVPVYWRPVRAGGEVDPREWYPVSATEEGRCVITWLGGEVVEVDPAFRNPLYETERRRFSLEAGENEVTLPVRPTTGFELVLLHGDEQVPVPDDWIVDDHSLYGPGRVLGSSAADGGLRVSLSGAGHYRFWAPPVPGFRKVDERTILVREGEYTRCEILLERE